MAHARFRTFALLHLLACVVVLGAGGRPAAETQSAALFTAEAVFSFPFPSDLTAAVKAPRIAWAFNEQGRRNIWVAEPPAFSARQLTQYQQDDGQELTSIGLTPAGDA